ncbi:hypothetical protein VUR80DRAFT_1931 [Thermomyces stellatus]
MHRSYVLIYSVTSLSQPPQPRKVPSLAEHRSRSHETGTLSRGNPVTCRNTRVDGQRTSPSWSPGKRIRAEAEGVPDTIYYTARCDINRVLYRHATPGRPSSQIPFVQFALSPCPCRVFI